MRRIAVLGAISVLAIALAGCTAPVVQKVAPTPHPTPTAKSELVVAVPNGVMASGSFRSADGLTAGTFEITSASGRFSIRFPKFRTTQRPGAFVSFSDRTVSAGTCGGMGPVQVEEADPLTDSTATRSFPLLEPNVSLADPTFLKTILVQSFDMTTSCDGNPIIAVAPIAWRIPETHPNLRLVDHGVSYSAWGHVTMNDGKPFTYLTHQGDDWTHIAKRFGITTSDLTWLNPVRIGGDKPEAAYIGQLLNLDPDNRGNSESRRHPE